MNCKLLVAVVALAVVRPACAQQEPDASTAASQGNQGVQGGEIETTQITGEGVRTGGLAENGGLQSAFGATDANTFFTAISQASQAGGRGNTRQFNITGGTGSGNNRTGGSSAKTRQVRPRFRLGFVPSTALKTGAVQTRTTARISRMAQRIKSFSGVQATAGADGVLTLTGRVESASAKRLATNLLRLEPGVRSVRNQLQVAATTATPGTPATPPTPAGG